MNGLQQWLRDLNKPSIGRRFAVQILMFSSVVTLLSTAIQLTLDYRRDVNGIEEQLIQIRDSYSPSLASSLWVTSRKDLQLQLDGILRLPDMQYLEVTTEDNQVLATAGSVKITQIISHEFPLYYTNRNTPLYLGTLHIVATLDGVYARLRSKILVILITQGVKTFLVSLFILYLFQTLVGRHLRTIADFSAATHGRKLDELLTLKRPHNKHTSGDELEQTVQSINEMRLRLQIYYQELQESEYRWKFALEGSGNGVWDWDVSSSTIIYSDRYKEMLGYTRDDFNGDVSDWEQRCHEEDRAQVRQAVQAHFNGGAPSFVCEFRTQHKDGRWLWVIARGTVVVRDKDNKALRMIGTITDISAQRVAAEREAQLSRQLLQATKMESIGHLTGGIAHDFNNILGAIMGYAELTHNIMATKPENYSQLQPYIQQILSASERAKQLIAQMLVFSRLSPEIQPGQSQVVMLSPIIKEVISLLRSSIPAKISLNYQPLDNDVHVRIQPVHLHQVLLNLGINARDAIDEYGDIQFGVTLRDKARGVCTSCNQSIDGRFVDISVKDSGSGIADHILHSIFDPFFTTKAVGKGTGMGLSVVHGIVHEAGGHIQVESAEGSGTTFHILLPVIAAAGTSSQIIPAQAAIPAPTLQGCRIMVIDDEKAMTSMLKDVLETQGARVTVYNNPLSALNTLSNKMNEFDLVITDESMPELSGMHLAKMLLNIRPGIPIILCTGYSETATAEAAAALGIAAFMYKPLDTNALIRKIAALTGQA